MSGVDVRAPALCVHLSHQECRQLYAWLGEDAPFVRHQLRVVGHGGDRDVALTTAEERRQVLFAISAGGRGRRSLTGGLRSLETALEASDGRIS